MAQISSSDPVFASSVSQVVQRSGNIFSQIQTFTAGLTVSAGTATFDGNVVINAPASGLALAVTGVAGTYAVQISSAASGTEKGLLINAGAAVGDVALLVENQAASATFLELFGDGHGTIGYNGSGATISFAAAGNVVVAAPSSGVALTITGSGAGTTPGLTVNDGGNSRIAFFNSTAANGGFIAFQNSGTTIGEVGSSAEIITSGASGDFAVTSLGASAKLVLGVNAVNALTIASDRGVEIGAPTGGSEGAGTVNVAGGYYVNGTNQFQSGSFTGTFSG